MSTNIRSNLLDFFTESKLPVLEAIILATVDSYPSMIPILFNMEMMGTDIYQTTTYSGLKNPKKKPENETLEFQSIKPGFAKTFIADTYATGYRISREMVKDGKVSFIERATNSFSKGFFEIREFGAASIFDDGFTVNGYDGVPLFSTQHPLENGDGNFGINRPADPSELSTTSLRELRDIMQSTVNEDGQLIQIPPSYLVVPQALQDTAKELMLSEYDPNNANNNINTLAGGMKLLPGGYWNYLGSDTAFFLMADKMYHHLMFLDREAMYTDSDYDKKAFAYELMAAARFTYGHAGWRGTAGNPGL